MNVFWREIKAYRTSTIIWAIALSSLVYMFFTLYPSFAKDVTESQKLLVNLPEIVRKALDISIGNFFTVYGFFAYLFTFVSLAGAVQAMNLGVGIISKEESGKTADFLLSKPISRSKVIISKIMAGLVLLVVTNLVFVGISLLAATGATTTEVNYGTFLLIALMLLLVQLAFFALGMGLSALIPRVKSPITVTLPVVFGFFIIGTLGAIIGNDNVRYLSPFKFYEANYIISHHGYEPKFLIIEAAIIIVALVATYIIYINKDIKAAS